MSEQTKGLWALIAACATWGVSGLFYKMLAAVPPLEILAHRTLWSLVFFGLVLLARGGLADLGRALSSRWVGVVALAAVVISLNWFGFIWSVQNGHAMEASLGYYIFPLVAVGLGVAFLRERMTPSQALAVALAAAAVLWLTWSVGRVPWIALFLAGTFGIYGLVKKRLPLTSTVSVAAEVVLLAPLALGFLLAEHFGWGMAARPGAFGSGLQTTLMLMFSGVLTGLPLMMFSYATQRVRLSTVGLVQYLNPTLQFVVALFAFGEPLTHAHAVAFPLIWAALAIYSVASLRR